MAADPGRQGGGIGAAVAGAPASWIVTAYMLAGTIAAVLAGKSGDTFGNRRIFPVGVMVFIAGSLVWLLANNMPALTPGHAMQGMGTDGSVVTPGVVSGVTAVIGPLLGGVLTDRLSWKPTG
nr:MFS transporter [Streptomyces odonnellii]